MGVHFTSRERSVLFGLLADNATDIILKTDRRGFIVNASPSLERLGIRLPGLLIGPHLFDLAAPSCKPTIQAEHEAVLNRRQDSDWVEFSARTADNRPAWFAIRMCCLTDQHGEAYGTLSMMRSIQERRTLEDRLFAAEMTDPLTGLTNRRAFIAMMQHLIDTRAGGCVALFDIDRLMTINMQYGQAAGDELIATFAEFLRTLVRQEDTVSRIGGENFGVLLPRVTPDRAEAMVGRIVRTLSDIAGKPAENCPSITASAAVARIGRSLDATLKQAEIALFIAKAKGRNRVEMAGNS